MGAGSDIVEETGSAIIAVIVVELLPNQDGFQDYYPDLDSDDVELEKDDQIDSQFQIRDINRKISELCIEDGRLRNIISKELEEACKNKVKMQKVKGKEKEKKFIRERLLAQEKNRIKKDKKAH
ncbi:hypothetical protein F5X96DRAFT_674819 [Biscogniauxia mediterranea]|nr:hypothetical protein F5X96DRAFT_674819 [Biscogniauxia mediterranea]